MCALTLTQTTSQSSSRKYLGRLIYRQYDTVGTYDTITGAASSLGYLIRIHWSRGLARAKLHKLAQVRSPRLAVVVCLLVVGGAYCDTAKGTR